MPAIVLSEHAAGKLLKETPEDKMYRLMEDAHLPLPQRHYQFCEGRKWEADFCWPIGVRYGFGLGGIILEIEGGGFSQGRHVRGRGYQDDCTKYNAATLLGYTIYRVTPKHIDSGYAIMLLRKVLAEPEDFNLIATRRTITNLSDTMLSKRTRRDRHIKKLLKHSHR